MFQDSNKFAVGSRVKAVMRAAYPKTGGLRKRLYLNQIETGMVHGRVLVAQNLVAGLGIDNKTRAVNVLKGISGKRLTYRRTDEARAKGRVLAFDQVLWRLLSRK